MKYLPAENVNRNSDGTLFTGGFLILFSNKSTNIATVFNDKNKSEIPKWKTVYTRLDMQTCTFYLNGKKNITV